MPSSSSERTPPHGTPERIAYLAARPALSLPEVGELLGLSLSSVRRAVDRGEVPVVRLGRRVLVPTTALLDLLGGDAA